MEHATSSGGAALLVVVVPGLLAFVFGYFAFRSRVKGVYFSIITQALTFAAMLLFFRNDTGFGGNNGFTDFKRILGFPITTPRDAHGAVRDHRRDADRHAAAGALASSPRSSAACSPRSATPRRASMFCGYDTLHYKLFVWTLSAVLCGIAGALYVPQVGIINPSEMSPANSIEIAIWVAVGGRGTLVGADRSAPALVNGAKSFFTQAFPEYWLFFLGLLFILVTLFLPQGVRRAGRSTREGRHEQHRDAPGRRATAATSGDLGRVATGRPRHSRTASVLYLEDITRQLRRLPGAEQPVARRSTRASCAASSAPTAPARPR